MRKADDIHNAVTFLGSRPEVDQERLAAVGVCASSGYTALNATRDERVRSLVLIAPWLHDAGLVLELYGGEEGVRERVEAGEAAPERHERDRRDRLRAPRSAPLMKARRCSATT